ncbi:DUF454 domain-containing protein [Nitrosomonas sp. HPC101]|uniref:YbaN family protein n=1 Tax=Nitrosomonas sp. HPC101 TaxID=1658667 RepID=UPI001368DA58|nr:YbaN family protein [Nitrosomonas sp. HPC101]MXS86361.1 DUF454 domain-containing protein [Nitrosomonas sp. HPC101]
MSTELNKSMDQSQANIHLLQLHDSPVIRWLYLCIGVTALFVGILGIFLPILPTTPFILLAAGCFARSSERFHNYLLGHRIAGPIIREWCEYRSVKRQVKRWAYLVMLLSFGSSILIVSSWKLKGMLVLLATILFTFIWRLPVRDENK